MSKNKKVFEQGDVVWVNLNPTSGTEMQGNSRPCLVLSKSEFNAQGRAVVAPITQGNFERDKGFAVPVHGSKVQGAAMVSQIRTLDLDARGAAWSGECLDEVIVQDALARLAPIFGLDE